MSIICAADQQQRAKAWKSYRNHIAKTQALNAGIESRIRVTFPRISREEAAKLRDLGPTPKELEYNKQLAIYSDCLDDAGECVAHYPAYSEWRQFAWDRLCEGQALVSAFRDRTPDELAVFQKHYKQRSG
jgi:hypothetical protein